MKFLKLYIAFIFCFSTIAVRANTYTPADKETNGIIRATEHSLIAPEGTRYQWYLNNIKIEGAIDRELAVTSAGFYKVERTTLSGDVIEKNTIVGLTAAGAIIRIFTIGDSTVQDYTAGYYPRKGWGQVLPIFFNAANVSVINKAVGGTSSKSFYNDFWPAVRDALQAGDFVFIQFGINDRNSTDPARYTPTGGEFESYLTKYVNETKAKGAYPVLVATLRRNAWNANGTVYDAYHDHPVATRTVAASLGVPLIDLDAKAKVLMESVGQKYCTRLLYNNYLPGEYPNYPNGNNDQVHFQEMGAIEMAKLVTQGIRELSADPNVKKLIPFLKPEYQIAVYVNPVGSDSVTTHTTTYPQGLTITLKTIPKKTGTFQKWNTATGTQLSTATQTTVISRTAAISYTAMYTGSTACSASINSSTATTFCAGGSIVLTASTGSSYKWFNGTTQVGTASTYTATATGNYTVEVTNAAGCKATSAVKTITVNPLPVITHYVKVDAGAWLTAATASVCEASTVNLGPQPNLAAGWTWTGPNNFTSTLRNPVLSNIVVANAGNYIATYTDANGCKATSTFVLQVSKPTATITSPATSFCTSGSLLLTASTGASYKWFNGSTQVGTAATYTAIAAGQYTVEVTNTAGCKATSAVTQISVNTLPTATITSPASSFCTGGSLLLTSSTGASYKWFNGTTQVGTAATYTATTAGAYTVEVTNAAGCKSTSAVTQITMNTAPNATITSPATSFCTGGSVVLTASAGSSYKWFNGTTQIGTNATYTATAAGAYSVEVTNAAGCKSTSAVTQIAESTQVTPTITTPSTSFCAGGSVVLTSSAGTSYKWINETTQVGSAASYTATTAGSYTVEVTNAAGCKATSAVTQISVTSTVVWYADTDNDGIGDIASTINACTKPTGYVATSGDACPADANKTTAGNCGCGQSETSCLDCNGTPNGTAFLDNCSICVGGTTGKTVCITTATVNGTSANISVVPQPFDINTTITVENFGVIQSYTIISASGTLVETKNGLNTKEITLGETISSGLYTVIITTEKGLYTTKVVKK
ncbi:GDSL-type esterase/lipase family protein [Cytophaga aurantiaca]|uniref:Ig-like domain-containing protein n=1 Tax=Cytophaga aurantiaca TaxID=29530 RepID=UPI00037A9BEB|nr:GDSL-type esterase/lipase family protein [Cytophaga aurantiaca]